MGVYTSFQDPGQSILRQQNRRDDQFRNMLNMFMLSKQMKQKQEQTEYERQQDRDKAEFEQEKWGMQQQVMGSQIGAQDALAAQRMRPDAPTKPSSFQEKYRFAKTQLGMSDKDAAYFASPSSQPKVIDIEGEAEKARDKADKIREAQRKKDEGRIVSFQRKVSSDSEKLSKRLEKMDETYAEIKKPSQADVRGLKDARESSERLKMVGRMIDQLYVMSAKAPLPEEASALLAMLVKNYDKIKRGEGEFGGSWTSQASLGGVETPSQGDVDAARKSYYPDVQDEFGFSVGQQRVDEQGNTWVYAGGNRWNPIK